MKGIVILLLLWLSTWQALAQERIIYVQEFKSGSKGFNLEFNKATESYKVKIKDKGSDEERDFETQLVSEEVFASQFADSLHAFDTSVAIIGQIDLGKRFFHELNAAKTLYSTSVQIPAAGVIEVPSQLDVILDINGREDTLRSDLEKIVVVFEDGYIEDIAVFVKTPKDYKTDKIRGANKAGGAHIKKGTILRFENNYPLGFSSKTNFRKLRNHVLWEQSGNSSQHIRLNQAIKYSPSLDLDTKDYSPKDSRLELKPGEERILYKAEFNKLFEIVAFTDLVGVDEEKPNGLVQLDFKKRFLLNTSRYKPRGWLLGWIPFNYGAMENVVVRALISKIEENNRRLFLDTPPRSPNEAPLVNTIDILNHQIYSLGADFNFFTADWPNLKSRLNFFLGFRYGRTLIADSISMPGTQIDFGINTTAFTPKLRYQLISEKRTGFMMEAGYNYLYTRSDQVKQVDNMEEYLNSGPSQVDPIFFFLMELRYSNNSENGNVFLRYQFNHIDGDINQNFSQLQFGYTFDILGRKREKK